MWSNFRKPAEKTQARRPESELCLLFFDWQEDRQVN